MNTKDKLRLMLMGPKNGSLDTVEERGEPKMSRKANAREESLEDAKGRPIKMKVPFKKGK
jgi:hypothetical protein